MDMLLLSVNLFWLTNEQPPAGNYQLGRKTFSLLWLVLTALSGAVSLHALFS